MKALGLSSGGLDSTLALKIIASLGIEVVGLHFYTGFCITEQKRRLGIKTRSGSVPKNHALAAGAEMEIPIEMIDISETYMDMVVKPKFGYGKRANPCIDCRIFMLKKAKEIMEERGYDFIFTGEVLGQRPMSQRRDTMNIVERESGLKGKLLRPLSAKLMRPTIIEQEGNIDRSKLFAIAGRSRKKQLELAEQFGMTEYSTPAGGCCFLADEKFSDKFHDYLAHHENPKLNKEEVLLLSVGRHFRLRKDLKLIMGREQSENVFLSRLVGRHGVCQIKDIMGPLVLIEGNPTEAEMKLIAELTASYGQGKNREQVIAQFKFGDNTVELLITPTRHDDTLEAMRI